MHRKLYDPLKFKQSVQNLMKNFSVHSLFLIITPIFYVLFKCHVTIKSVSKFIIRVSNIT